MSELFSVSIHVLRRGRCVTIRSLREMGYSKFQSTSSEEDVVSSSKTVDTCQVPSFNPRPPKRTLCLLGIYATPSICCVSIHVLRRGRCVPCTVWHKPRHTHRFNPRPPKRTLCQIVDAITSRCTDVSIHVLRRGRCVKNPF